MSTPVSAAPSTGTILSRYKRRIQREQPKPTIVSDTTNKQTLDSTKQQEINVRMQLYLIAQRLPYQMALEYATSDIRKKYATNATQTTTPTASVIPIYDDIDYVDVQVSKIIGPFNRGANFDIMLFNVLTNEGILHRNTSDKYYTIVFPTVDKQTVAIPKLMRECTKQKAPTYFSQK
ncbi:MAG: hypothetical protein PHN45_00225 [Methylococcales bacterium]|nr:hypothetical protein [Methylococcales bacterium]